MTRANPNNPLDVLILAAGLGRRMKSNRAKVLHELGGRPLIAHVSRTAARLDPSRIHVVVGYQADEVRRAVENELGTEKVAFIHQSEQRGTGDAVMVARPSFESSQSTILILSGDVPLIKLETLCALHDKHRDQHADCTILTVRLENPTGYGRIIRDDGKFLKIIEQNDATDEERSIREINAGIYCFESKALFSALEDVKPTNKQAEYYLTDVPAI